MIRICDRCHEQPSRIKSIIHSLKSDHHFLAALPVLGPFFLFWKSLWILSNFSIALFRCFTASLIASTWRGDDVMFSLKFEITKTQTPPKNSQHTTLISGLGFMDQALQEGTFRAVGDRDRWVPGMYVCIYIYEFSVYILIYIYLEAHTLPLFGDT